MYQCKWYFFVRIIYRVAYFVGLTIQATILAYMFSLLENGKITVTLAPTSGPSMQNVPYIQQFLMNLLKAAFPHLNE